MSQAEATDFEDWLSTHLELLATEAEVVMPSRLSERTPIRLRQRAIFISAAAIFVLAGLGLLQSFRSDVRSSGSASGVTNVEVIDGLEIAVTGNQRRERGTTIYQATFGPEPQFDTSLLGVDVSLVTSNPEDFIVPTERFLFWERSQLASEFVLLGEIDGYPVGLNSHDGNLCIFLGNGTAVFGGGECRQNGDSSETILNAAPSVDPPIQFWVAWPGLPSRTSVVAAHFEDGTVRWQRPVGRTAFFLTNDSRIESFSFYAADGSTIVP